MQLNPRTYEARLPSLGDQSPVFLCRAGTIRERIALEDAIAGLEQCRNTRQGFELINPLLEKRVIDPPGKDLIDLLDPASYIELAMATLACESMSLADKKKSPSPSPSPKESSITSVSPGLATSTVSAPSPASSSSAPDAMAMAAPTATTPAPGPLTSAPTATPSPPSGSSALPRPGTAELCPSREATSTSPPTSPMPVNTSTPSASPIASNA